MDFLGVLMLQTRFPRLPGDVGDAGSFAMPVRHRVVSGATPQRVVRDGDPALIEPFIAAGRALDGAVLRAAGADVTVPVQGIHPHSALARTLLQDRPELDAAAAQSTVVEAAVALCAAHPEIGVIVLECTNMPPYRDAVAQACRRPVHDVMTLVHRRWAGLVRQP